MTFINKLDFLIIKKKNNIKGFRSKCLLLSLNWLNFDPLLLESQEVLVEYKGLTTPHLFLSNFCHYLYIILCIYPLLSSSYFSLSYPLKKQKKPWL